MIFDKLRYIDNCIYNTVGFFKYTYWGEGGASTVTVRMVWFSTLEEGRRRLFITSKGKTIFQKMLFNALML